MNGLFSGEPTRFQQKNASATRNPQTFQTQSSPPTLRDALQPNLNLLVPNPSSQNTVKIPSPRTRRNREAPDPFFGSEFVYSLNALNSREFLSRRAAVLVLFYCPHDRDITAIKNHYSSSASSTKRDNHAYAAVDCTVEPDLCTRFGVSLTPFVAYFSRGVKIDSASVESKEFVKDDLAFFMERAPIFNDPNLKTYGKMSLARKTLQGIKSPGRKPPELNVSPGRKVPKLSGAFETKTESYPSV